MVVLLKSVKTIESITVCYMLITFSTNT